jgi:hypothetical protein
MAVFELIICLDAIWLFVSLRMVLGMQFQPNCFVVGQTALTNLNRVGKIVVITHNESSHRFFVLFYRLSEPILFERYPHLVCNDKRLDSILDPNRINLSSSLE